MVLPTYKTDYVIRTLIDCDEIEPRFVRMKFIAYKDDQSIVLIFNRSIDTGFVEHFAGYLVLSETNTPCIFLNISDCSFPLNTHLSGDGQRYISLMKL